MPHHESPTVDPKEIEHFSRMAEDWWNPQGKFAPLHRLAPQRLAYIKGQICQYFQRDIANPQALSNLQLLDIGCGGGLVSEPMARLGATVTAIDATEKNIHVASIHAQQQGLDIDYRFSTTDKLVQENARFDVVLALEILEHVADVEQFIRDASALCQDNGVLIFSTINRTPQSFIKAIIGAEYVLRWLPRGTHHWQKFLTPAEVMQAAERAGLHVQDVMGLTMHPLTFAWRLSDDLSVNYFVTASKYRAPLL